MAGPRVGPTARPRAGSGRPPTTCGVGHGKVVGHRGKPRDDALECASIRILKSVLMEADLIIHAPLVVRSRTLPASDVQAWTHEVIGKSDPEPCAPGSVLPRATKGTSRVKPDHEV